MKIDVKCFSTLVNEDKCDYRESTTYTLEDNQTVEDLARVAGVDINKVKIAFVNSRSVDFSTVLSDGDRVALAPASGGM